MRVNNAMVEYMNYISWMPTSRYRYNNVYDLVNAVRCIIMFILEH